MKKASQNVSSSLRGQKPAGRSGESISVGKMGSVKSVSTIPGEGGVEVAPGRVDVRSAVHHADPMSRFGGK